VYKIAASVAQLANCILLHAHSSTTTPICCVSTNKNFVIPYLTSWHNSIFDYKLRTNKAENP